MAKTQFSITYAHFVVVVAILLLCYSLLMIMAVIESSHSYHYSWMNVINFEIFQVISFIADNKNLLSLLRSDQI